MAENSAIEWTDHTFNPWIGCRRVSPGCDNCYAAHLMDTRLGRVVWDTSMRNRTKTWGDPVRWNKQAAAAGVRKRVFCASLADVFDNEVPHAWREELLTLIEITPWLNWLLLTKRIGNAAEMLWRWEQSVPWPNVWLGATVVNQEEADRDIPKLLATPAHVRFLSIEPILGDVNLTRIMRGHLPAPVPGELRAVDGWCEHNALTGVGISQLGFERDGGPRVDWVIVGGESGPRARPTTIGHIRGVVRQCQSADVPVFVKQLGARPVNREGVRHPLQHPKGGDPAEWPEDLRVRKFL